MGISINWTAISSVATAVMAFATFLTIYYNRKQIKEMQKQWYEANKARIIFSIISYRKLFLLKIENIGNETAYNVQISINDSFKNKMLVVEYKERLNNLSKKRLYMPPHNAIYYQLSPVYISGTLNTEYSTYNSEQIKENLNVLVNEPLTITAHFNGNECIKETITINDSLGLIKVNSPETDALLGICSEIKNAKKHII